MPNLYSQKLKELENQKKYNELADLYIGLLIKIVEGTASKEEMEAGEGYSEYLGEPMGKSGFENQNTPKRDPEFLVNMLEQFLARKGELNIELAQEAEKIADQIQDGEYPGLEQYANDPRTALDLAGVIVSSSDKARNISALSKALFDTTTNIVDYPIDDNSAKRLGVEPGTTFSQFLHGLGEKIVSDHLAENSLLHPDEFNYLRAKGGDLNTSISDYGLQFKDGKIEPFKTTGYTGELHAGYSKLDDEPVIDYDGSIIKNQVHAVADPAYFLPRMRENHYEKMLNLKDSIDSLAEMATVMQEKLEKLKAHKSNQSDEFNAMSDALDEVAELSDSNTPVQIMKAFDKLKNASKAYMDRIDSSMFRGVFQNGRERRSFAEDINNFAATGVKKLDGIDRYFNRKRGVADQIDKFNEKTIEIKNEEKINENKAPEVKQPAKEKADLKELIKDEAIESKKASSNPERDEVLRKRMEIMNKRKENEKKGIASDNKNHVNEL